MFNNYFFSATLKIRGLSLKLRQVALLLAFLISPAQAQTLGLQNLSEDEIEWLGQQIFKNECNQKLSCLTHWNDGEDFPSLGLGHFIWYQSNQDEIFEQSFPQLLRFIQSSGIAIPQWIIEGNFNSPWPNQQSFQAEFNSARTVELREFLADTRALQTEFILQRFGRSLRGLARSMETEEESEHLLGKAEELSRFEPPYGLYALIDYVHFKGTGSSTQELYNGQGWGLIQVLQSMPEHEEVSLQNYVESARQVLQNRVNNAPAERNEQRWIPGWFNRLDSYLPSVSN